MIALHLSHFDLLAARVAMCRAHAVQPCIGKTTFYEHWFKPRGYVAVGHQINGNLGKMLAAIRDSIAQGKAIVVDETNGLGAHARLAAVR